MRVLQVLNHFLPHQAAGTEVYTWALSKHLQQRNIEVKILIPNYGQSSFNQYVYDNLEVFQYAEPSIVDRSLILGLREPEGLSAFCDFLKAEKPDIVHFHELAGSNGLGLAHIEAAKKLGARIIITIHVAKYTCRTGTLMFKDEVMCDGKMSIEKCTSCYLHMKGDSFVNKAVAMAASFLYKTGLNTTSLKTKTTTALGSYYQIETWHNTFHKMIDLCDRVVVLTEWYKRMLLLNRVQEEKLALIPQMLPQGNKIKYNTLKKSEDPVRLIFIGRISPFKGLHLLMNAIVDFPEDQIKLDIFGQSTDDEYNNKLKKISAFKKNIAWKGMLDPTLVVDVMRNYDALCLCSTLCEMSPLVIQEAFAAGITVIASNVYGNSEQIQHNHNGLLFKFNSVNSLKKQLNRLVSEHGLITKLQQNVKLPISAENVAADYFALYKTVTA